MKELTSQEIAHIFEIARAIVKEARAVGESLRFVKAVRVAIKIHLATKSVEQAIKELNA